jgi:excinuclease ABC subunit B
MYADRETDSMRKAISVTRARRQAQETYNQQHGITPRTIQKAIADLAGTAQDDFVDITRPSKKVQSDIPLEELPQILAAMRKEMHELSEALEFEKAAAIRDKIKDLEEIQLAVGV